MSSAPSARRLVAVFAILLHVAAAPAVRASVAEAPDAVGVDHKKLVRDVVDRFLGPVSSLDIAGVFWKLPSFEDAMKPPATAAAVPAGAPSADPALARSVTSFLSAIGHEMSAAAAAAPPPAAENPKEEGDVVASRTAAASFLSAIGHETWTLPPAAAAAAAAHENPKEEGDVGAAAEGRRAGTADIAVSAFVAAFGFFVL